MQRQLLQPALPARYEPQEVVGRGAMGVVWRVHDRVLARDVAVKVLAEYVADEGLAARLAREARILARLEHPGVVTVHDAGTTDDGRSWYAMRFIRGRRLDDPSVPPPTIGDV
ncbi:MAG: protein kinase, partial [Gemmatimonadaceae bacterium]|nr:protein kinase [Gemmatimonadaceae bacterium]